MNTKDMNNASGLFVLITGEPGTGKSIAAHSFPQPSFTFDFDQKMKAVSNYYSGIDFEYDNYENVFDVRTKLSQFKQSCEFKTIVWDGWSTFARLALKSMMDTRNPNSKKIIRGNIEKYQIEDYGGESRAIELCLDDLKAINIKHNVHVVTVCHIIRVVTHNIIKNTDTTYQGLHIPGGKIAFDVPIPYDEVWNMSKEQSLETGDLDYIITTSGSSEVGITKTAMKLPSRFIWSRNSSLYETILLKHNSYI